MLNAHFLYNQASPSMVITFPVSVVSSVVNSFSLELCQSTDNHRNLPSIKTSWRWNARTNWPVSKYNFQKTALVFVSRCHAHSKTQPSTLALPVSSMPRSPGGCVIWLSCSFEYWPCSDEFQLQLGQYFCLVCGLI